jgi:hypothetical protein
MGGHTGPVERDRGLQLLNFLLLEGQTTRENVLEQWGVPFSAYEDGRIWTYAMVPGRRGTLAPQQPEKPYRSPEFAAWKDKTYHLILIFEGDLLRSYHLLRIS